MAESRSQSPADAVLARQASRIARQPVTPGQIRRWRKAGLLPMRRTGLGRGRGWRYEYPEGSAEFAAGIARELPRQKRLDLAALATFAHGTSPTSKEVLVRLLQGPLDAAQSSLGADPHRAATRFANKASRRASRSPLLSQAKGIVGRPGSFADFLHGGFDFAFAGEPAGLRKALQALNVSASTSEEVLADIESQFGSPRDALKHLSLVSDAMQEANLVDFEQARDDALAMYKGSRGVIQALASLVDIASEGDTDEDDAEAMGLVPVFLVIRDQLGDERTDALLEYLENPISLFGQIVGVFQEWSAANPEDAARLGPIGKAVLQRTLQP